MALLLVLLRPFTPHIVHKVFGKAQLVSAAWMAHSHGTNDAQKTMGIIALALFTGTKSGAFKDLPPMFNFLHTPDFIVPNGSSFSARPRWPQEQRPAAGGSFARSAIRW